MMISLIGKYPCGFSRLNGCSFLFFSISVCQGPATGASRTKPVPGDRTGRFEPKASRGFTLLELLLVVLIIGIAAAAVVPNFGRSTGRLELKKAAEDLAAAIRYGQMRAMSRGRYLRLNTDAAGYWLEEDRSSSEEKRPAEAARDFIRLQDRWGRRSDFPAGITLSPVGNEVMINPDGRMSALDLRLCRAQCCLIVTTGRQRGRVEIEGEESDERGALP